MFLSPAARMQLTERVRRFFGGNPCRVQAAALPWRHSRRGNGIEILLVTTRETGRWVLPKGWPEGGETLAEAAAREAFEEAGVRGITDDVPFGHFYYNKLQGTGVEWRCRVAVVPLFVEEQSAKWPERKERNRRWFNPRDARRLVDESDLGELMEHFADNPREIAA